MSAKPMKVHLEAVLFQSADPESLAEFYHQAFNLHEPRYFGADHLGMDLENTYLGFDRVNDAGGIQHSRVQLWFQAQDVEAQFQRLVSLGARVIYPPESESSLGEVLAMVFDPEGHQVGLIGKAVPG